MDPRNRNRSLLLSVPLAALVACSAPSSNGGTPQKKTEAPPATPTSAAEIAAKPADTSKRPETGPARAPKPGYVGEDDLISRETLSFASPAKAAAYDKLVGCLARYGEDWTAYPLRRYGNFVNIEWCRGQGSNINCAGGDTRTTPGAGWGSVSLLQHERDWPAVFGLSFTTGHIPETDGIAVSLSWARGGQSVLGDSSHVGFQKVEDGAVVSKLSLGMSQAFTVGEDEISSQTTGTPSEFYQRLVASPDSLRNEATAQLDALEAAVDAALAADSPRKCIYGPYEGGGIPPQCIRKEPLDEAEKEEAKARLSKLLTSQRALIANHADAMHSELLELMPASCWQPEP